MPFKRVFVHWAVEYSDWPGEGAEEMFRYSRVIKEYKFPPLEVLHYLLLTLRIGRHFKSKLSADKARRRVGVRTSAALAEILPFFVLKMTMPPMPASLSAPLANGTSA
ncbi:hypothetical protein [Cypionkella sp. TWP1-2-1b2]|uniref:hypothetical protein n=1 Tax=Cypionkella sp. TWP1-2-1b2 TaxID=2804675 RepID=UPI003CF447AD